MKKVYLEPFMYVVYLSLWGPMNQGDVASQGLTTPQSVAELQSLSKHARAYLRTPLAPHSLPSSRPHLVALRLLPACKIY